MSSIAVTGASGLIGAALCRELEVHGARVLRLVRVEAEAPDRVRWDPIAGSVDAPELEGVDAVVHLAGENVAGGRWTRARKQRIRDSRVLGTATLCRALAGLDRRPRVLVCASAIGIYGDRGDEELTERSAPGTGFLAEVASQWERAAGPAVHAGIRVVQLRIGLVLAREGGALPRMLLPFRLGLGGPAGSGRQWLSWIALPDVVSAVRFAIQREDLAGPVNTVAPQPATNREFARALGRALHRPAVLPLPAFAARLLLGEMADALLLASQRVLPARLLAAGFAFAHPALDGALRAVLSPADAGRTPPR